MGNEKKIRLIRAAKEFNVGLNTITDFLHRKGIEIDSSPNTPIDAETYAILEKEYGKNRPSGSELDSVREKINKKSTVSIEPTPAPQPKEEKRTIEVKDAAKDSRQDRSLTKEESRACSGTCSCSGTKGRAKGGGEEGDSKGRTSTKGRTYTGTTAKG